MNRQKILGDYQTPLLLARQIVSHLFSGHPPWQRILEPTCGSGNFIQACVDLGIDVEEMIGLDIQREYVSRAQKIQSDKLKITIHHQDIFEICLASTLKWRSDAPLLIVGNPPWITNSEQGRLNGSNLPVKSNAQKLSGLDALTGKSNFDVAESIWLKLLQEYSHQSVTIALLCKTAVARKIAQYIFQQAFPVNQMSLYTIDSKKWFDAAVDAGLFVVELNQGSLSYRVDVYDSFSSPRSIRTIGFINRQMVADVQTYRDVRFVEGECSLVWRQGVKHDAAKIMEVTYRDGQYKNGYNEDVDIEPDYLYPLIKSSDVKSVKPGFLPRKYVIVTQRQLGQNTAQLQYHAPKLWAYLNTHSEKLDHRKSSIYRNRPRFSMFGVGDYSFAPCKVVVSGFYLPAKFVMLPSHHKQVWLTDDTCYFLPFDEAWKALIVTALLNHPTVTLFLNSIVFPDAKRPITKNLLSRINLKAVYESVEFDDWMDFAADISREYDIQTDIPNHEHQIQALFGKQLQLF